MVDEIDQLSADAEEAAASADLTQIREAGERLLAIEIEIQNAEDTLANLKKEREEVRIKRLPELMAAVGVNTIGIGNRLLKLETEIQASLPKEDLNKREAAIDWMMKNGHGGVIKRKLVLDIPKGGAVIEERVKDAIASISDALAPKVDYDIHAQTYKAVCKQIVRSGEAYPAETLGIYVMPIVRVETK